jgi:hypothetical protein
MDSGRSVASGGRSGAHTGVDPALGPVVEAADGGASANGRLPRAMSSREPAVVRPRDAAPGLVAVVGQTRSAFSSAEQQVSTIRRVTTYGSTFALGRRSSM